MSTPLEGFSIPGLTEEITASVALHTGPEVNKHLRKAGEEIGHLLFEGTYDNNFRTGSYSANDLMFKLRDLSGERLDAGDTSSWDFLTGISSGLWSRVEQQHKEVIESIRTRQAERRLGGIK